MKEFFKNNTGKFSELGRVKGIPENTLDSVEEAFRQGADAVTLYFRLTSDFRLISIPEETLLKYTGEELRVSDLSAAELGELDAASMLEKERGFPYRGKGYRFFTLEDLFERFPHNRFNIVLMGKNNASAAVLSDFLARNNYSERILVSSDNSRIIKTVRRRLPRGATSFSLNEVVGYYALFRTGILAFRKRFPGDAIITPEFIGTSHIGNQGLIASAGERGIRVYIRGIGSRKEAEEMRLSGADGFITDDLSLLENLQ